MVERLGDIFLRKVYNFFFKKFLLLKANCIAVAVNIKLSE